MEAKLTMAQRLRETATELEKLDPCNWQHAWSTVIAALYRGNPDWGINGARSPIENMEAEFARLYDIEKMFKAKRSPTSGGADGG